MSRRFNMCLTALFLIALLGTVAGANQEATFDEWLAGVREEALGQDIRAETLNAAFAGVEPIERVVELDRKQPEFTMTFKRYLEVVAPDRRVERGRELLARHGDLLNAIGEKYGVQPRFIVALWGVESDFGRKTGSFSVIAALATLAYDGRRAEFFRGELLDALHILDERHVAPADMKGSWAGAMGQPQFMPSSFRGYAVDFNGDERRDIWGTLDDVLASAANYLSRHGWKDDQTWGRRVRLPKGFDGKLARGKTIKTIAEWQKLGVRRTDGSALPARRLDAAIVQMDDGKGAAYIVYDNWRTLKKWNRSDYFATGVGVLADRIAGR
ncbi:MAG: lytic murein transglycosylase [bacterium]|nr:lytic murein transglycosylase [bacterium]